MAWFPEHPCNCTHCCPLSSLIISFLDNLFFVSLQLVRLVANLSVHPKVGPAIACDEASVHQLLRILGKWTYLGNGTCASTNNRGRTVYSVYANSQNCKF